MEGEKHQLHNYYYMQRFTVSKTLHSQPRKKKKKKKKRKEENSITALLWFKGSGVRFTVLHLTSNFVFLVAAMCTSTALGQRPLCSEYTKQQRETHRKPKQTNRQRRKSLAKARISECQERDSGGKALKAERKQKETPAGWRAVVRLAVHTTIQPCCSASLPHHCRIYVC